MQYIAEGPEGYHSLISEKRKKRPHNLPPNFCPFCPGNEHLTPPATFELREGEKWLIRVIPNAFPAVSPENPDAYGYHEVVIESPDHGRTFWLHPIPHIVNIIKAWGERERALYQDPKIQYVAIFKNWGRRAGASIPHGHSQIIALPYVPRHIKEKRIPGGILVAEGEYWRVICPKAPRFPYHLAIVPMEGRESFHVYELNFDQTRELAYFLRTYIEMVTRIVDAYNLFVYTSPRDRRLPVHVEIFPRASIYGGFELGTWDVIVTVSPEKAAKYYRGEGF